MRKGLMPAGLSRRQRGYTLVELLVSMLIATLILAPLPMLVANALAAGAVNQSDYELQTQARFALDRITRQAGVTTHANLAPNASATTSGNWFSPVTFSWSGTQLTETDAAGSRIIADNVSAFSIVLLNRAVSRERIAVSLTITNGSNSLTRTETVQLGGAL